MHGLPHHGGPRPNFGPPEDPYADAAAFASFGFAATGLGGLSAGSDGLDAASVRMPRAPMPSGPPARWHQPPSAPPGNSPPSRPTGRAPGGRGLHDPQYPEVLANAPEMLAVVSQRVVPMLQAATKHSETQVSVQLRKLDAIFQSLREKAARVDSKLRAQSQTAKQLPKDDIAQMLMELEHRWDREISSVKRELHQTILAHNHNADLMADHKTAIDKISTDLDELGPPVHLEDSALQETLQRLGGTLEQNQTRDQEIDALLRRGELLFQSIGTSFSAASIGGVGMHATPYGGQAYQGYH